ncbi:glycosyltransferase [Bacteroides gallinaceum]|uniref:Glycosyltransferase n=1 Tax=Bacteroides gallinaceum TaxID=1462571 RepID=A0ABT7X251_9BACE|nr:glycosyltransferase family 2 protein [Bacteroides gallinaceum]MDN0048003.1 glycosyltransferase [Bacteroides gallinaceum]
MNTDKHLVSVLMPVYNSERFLADTIDNILSQSYEDIELIIVDDGSTDASYNIAIQYAKTDKRIKVFTQSHTGAWAARNYAFEKSAGDYVLYMDADDLLSPQKIEKQVELLNKADERSIITSEWDIFYSTPQDAKFSFRCLYKNYDNPIMLLIDMLNSGELMLVSCWLTPRQIIQQAGGWEQNITTKDDVLFFTKVLTLVSKVIFCPQAYVYYRKGHSSLSTTDTGSEQYLQSSWLACKLQAKILFTFDTSFLAKTGIARNFALIMCQAKYGSQIYNEAREAIYSLGLKPVHPFKYSKAEKVCRIIGYENFLRLRFLLQKIFK